MASDYLSFHLDPGFVAGYATRPVSWGFPMGGGNYFGEIQFYTKYSRLKEDGSKERWYECCERVINGMYSLLKDHCAQNLTPWRDDKAQRSAKEAYDRLFSFKWTPPGRGLWTMGTYFVNGRRDSGALQNCAFVSTGEMRTNPTLPFARLMEMQMLGVGVGFDTRGAGQVRISSPNTRSNFVEVVEDSRNGWADSVSMLLMSYFAPNWPQVEFDYSKVRPAGSPILGFGGISAGPKPLMELHSRLRHLFDDRTGEYISSKDIVDVMNLIGKAVMSANVRSAAEIALGDPHDEVFLDLKNPERFPERMGPNGWGYTSNNSVIAEVGGDYSHLVDRIATNGEPGLVYMDNCRKYGRLIDPPTTVDELVMGVNPCGEQPLEHMECCTLVETYPTRATGLEDYIRTIKFAFMYAKAVTLLPTRWPETNEVMQRNRRIGTSMSGIAQFIERHGWSVLRKWNDAAYHEVVSRDKQYSRWLGIRESNKRTTVKPAGTTSLLCGATPGVHWPTERDNYLRRFRLSSNDPIVEVMDKAGYHVEPNVANPEYGRVVTCPVSGPQMRNEREVSVWEKASLAATQQEWWSDNAVSCTISFLPEEKSQINHLLQAFDGRLKTISFLPLIEGGAFPQMPYERVETSAWQEMANQARLLDWNRLYAGSGGEAIEAEGEQGCVNDVCEIKSAEAETSR